MINKITLFFNEMTLRNWGVPWHLIIAWYATIVLYSFMPMQWVFPLIFVTGLVYEFFQLRDGQTMRGFAEDMAANIIGILSGWHL